MSSRDPMSRNRAPAQAFEARPAGGAPVGAVPGGSGWQVASVGALDLATNKTSVTFKQPSTGREQTQTMKRRYILGQVVDSLPPSE